MPHARARVWCLLAAVATLAAGTATAQELEPRALTNLPVGTNFVVLGYAFSAGNVLLDPTIPVEDLDAQLHTLVAAYARAIDVFGLSGKVDAIVPASTGRWTGILDNRDTMRIANGIGDPRVRLSVNLVGAPALRAGEFADYVPGTVVGASVQVWVPVGQYDGDRLLNLGSHRWAFAPQLGVSQRLGPWIVEAYASARFFTTNGDFFGGNTLDQRPFLAAKLHLVRTLSQRFWIALDGGIGAGARGVVNGEPRDNYQSAFRIGITAAGRISGGHSLKLAGVTTNRIDRGPDFDAVSLVYQFSWGDHEAAEHSWTVERAASTVTNEP
jgi:hypothetical protein